jgi:hypothetical protein
MTKRIAKTVEDLAWLGYIAISLVLVYLPVLVTAGTALLVLALVCGAWDWPWAARAVVIPVGLVSLLAATELLKDLPKLVAEIYRRWPSPQARPLPKRVHTPRRAARLSNSYLGQYNQPPRHVRMVRRPTGPQPRKENGDA